MDRHIKTYDNNEIGENEDNDDNDADGWQWWEWRNEEMVKEIF